MKNKKMIRHGDMFLIKLSEEEFKALSFKASKKIDKLVVGLGEVTGHSHDVIPVGNCEIIQHCLTETDDATVDRLFFELKNECGLITHDEHDAIALEVGYYARYQQHEFNYFEGVLQKVRD